MSAFKPKKLVPLKDRLAAIARRHRLPGAVDMNAWLADKKRRKAQYLEAREERRRARGENQ